MKETTGELNVTVVIVIAVAVLVAFFYFVIWPGLDANFQANSKCSRAICENPCHGKSGTTNKNACEDAIGKLVKCYYKDSKGNKTYMECPWKG